MEGATMRAMTRLPGQLVLALCTLALVLLVVRADLETQAPASVDTPSSRFASARALARLGRALGDQRPHPMGSPAGQAVARRIAAILSEDLAPSGIQEKGLQGLQIMGPEIHSVSACGRKSATCGQVYNVVVRLPGGDPNAGAILLSAHHDSVAAGPGAGDDGSGVAVLLELARLLSDPTTRERDDDDDDDVLLRRPLILLFVDGEEEGLIGAEAFLAGHPWARDVAFAINLDSGGNDGLATLTRTSAGNGPAIAALAATLERPRAASVTATAYALTPYDTDFTAYDRAGIFSLDFGIGEDKAPYHTPNDRLEALDPGSVQHLGESTLAALRALDRLDERELENAGERVYLDLLGKTLWTAPAPLIPWIAAILVGLHLAILRHLHGLSSPSPALGQHRAEPLLGPKSWACGAAVWALQLACALACGAALAWLLAVIAGAEMASYADPPPVRVALWATVMAASAAILVHPRVGRKLTPIALWGGAWSALALLTLLVAVVAPGASVALLPAFAAQALIAGAGLLFTQGRALPVTALLLGLVVPAFLWFQAALRVELLFGLGRHGGAIALAPIALLVGLTGPLWLAAPRRVQRVGLLLTTSIAIIASLASLLAPAHSPSRARRLNLVFHRDADRQESRWLIAERPGGVPSALRETIDLADAPAQSFAWSGEDDESYIAPAEEVDLAPPELELLDDQPGPWGRLITLRLRSPRGARRAALLLPESAGVRAVAIDDVTLAPYPERKLDHYPDARHFGIVGVPPEGVELRAIIAAEGPINATIWDIADGLPETRESRTLSAARPPDHSPTHGGDISLVSRDVTIE